MKEWAKRLLGYDTETTGTGPDARLLEFGAVLMEDAKVVTSYRVVVRPEGVDWFSPSVKEALEINQLRMQDIEKAKTFPEEFWYIKAALTQAPVRVGHNTPFDSRILRAEFDRCLKAGTLTKPDASGAQGIITLDTQALDYYLHPSAPSFKLEAVGQRWGVTSWQKHTAIGDADAAVRILIAMSNELPDDVKSVWAISRDSQQKWEEIHRHRYGKPLQEKLL